MILFARCERTRWTHLPVAGGWYDQDPQLLDEWDVIFAEKDVEERRREAERERKAAKSGRGRARRR